MKIQKTIKLLRGLALAGCFLITQQAVAQKLLGSGSAYYNVLGVGTDGTIRVFPTVENGESSIGFYTSPADIVPNQPWGGLYWIVGHKGWGNTNDFTIGLGGPENTGVKFLIQPDGKVGIGTTDPSALLDVNGTSHFEGNVGIGTINPAEKLHIMGNLRVDDGEYQSLGPVVLHPDTDNSGDDSIQFLNSTEEEIMRIHTDGNVGIGTTNPTEKLEVNGTVKATSFTSSAASFPDYVFAADYKITPLTELETYVKQHQHLPNMPSEKEVIEQGLNMPEVIIKSVENIETIYLHLIRMEKEIEALKQENADLKQQLKQRH